MTALDNIANNTWSSQTGIKPEKGIDIVEMGNDITKSLKLKNVKSGFLDAAKSAVIEGLPGAKSFGEKLGKIISGCIKKNPDFTFISTIDTDVISEPLNPKAISDLIDAVFHPSSKSNSNKLLNYFNKEKRSEKIVQYVHILIGDNEYGEQAKMGMLEYLTYSDPERARIVERKFQDIEIEKRRLSRQKRLRDS